MTIAKNGTLSLFGDTYRPATPLPPGLTVVVHRAPRGTLSVRSAAAAETEAVELAAAARSREEETHRKRAAEREQNRAINEALHVPVAWLPDVKPVMSGLSERNPVDGTRRGSVHHVRLLADLVDGRLRRRRGQFLCGNREKWADLFPVEDREDDPFHDLGHAAVTCKSCLRTATRWQPDEQSARQFQK